MRSAPLRTTGASSNHTRGIFVRGRIALPQWTIPRDIKLFHKLMTMTSRALHLDDSADRAVPRAWPSRYPVDACEWMSNEAMRPQKAPEEARQLRKPFGSVKVSGWLPMSQYQPRMFNGSVTAGSALVKNDGLRGDQGNTAGDSNNRIEEKSVVAAGEDLRSNLLRIEGRRGKCSPHLVGPVSQSARRPPPADRSESPDVVSRSRVFLRHAMPRQRHFAGQRHLGSYECLNSLDRNLHCWPNRSPWPAPAAKSGCRS